MAIGVESVAVSLAARPQGKRASRPTIREVCLIGMDHPAGDPSWTDGPGGDLARAQLSGEGRGRRSSQPARSYVHLAPRRRIEETVGTEAAMVQPVDREFVAVAAIGLRAARDVPQALDRHSGRRVVARPRRVRPGAPGRRAGAAGPDDPGRLGGRPRGGRGRLSGPSIPPPGTSATPATKPGGRGSGSAPSWAPRPSKPR